MSGRVMMLHCKAWQVATLQRRQYFQVLFELLVAKLYIFRMPMRLTGVLVRCTRAGLPCGSTQPASCRIFGHSCLNTFKVMRISNFTLDLQPRVDDNEASRVQN